MTIRSFVSAISGNALNDKLSNDNFLDISILHQVLEIEQFHQFSFTSQQLMLNSQQNLHWLAIQLING